MKLNAKNISLCAVLIALSLAISVFEGMLPASFIPLPGVKLGLSNIVTLYAIYSLGAVPAIIILICRCVLASFFGGGITSLIFSLFGGIFAVCAMLCVKNLKHISIFGVSILGASFHSLGQIVAACLLLRSAATVYYLPVMLLTSVFTGALTALCAGLLIRRIKNV